VYKHINEVELGLKSRSLGTGLSRLSLAPESQLHRPDSAVRPNLPKGGVACKSRVKALNDFGLLGALSAAFCVVALL